MHDTSVGVRALVGWPGVGGWGGWAIAGGSGAQGALLPSLAAGGGPVLAAVWAGRGLAGGLWPDALLPGVVGAVVAAGEWGELRP